MHHIASIRRPSLIESRKVTCSLSRLRLNNIHGHASTSAVAKDTGIPQRSVARILRSIGMHPYKITLCQEIKETRLEFARWILANQDKLDNIVLSDEAYFTLDETVNRHNLAFGGLIIPIPS